MTPSSMRSFQRKLLAWYRKGTRTGMPWRGSRNPYHIWISEAMLQQTQVETVTPYYHRFLKRFPTVEALGRARLTEVLEAWSGLGYYSRAKNLHAAAAQILKQHGGRIPDQPEALLALPGIGRYTAGAIASIAFGKPAAVLDGNVTRVLCRYFAMTQDPRTPRIQRRLWELAQALLVREAPGDFNQALMDLGATVCVPRQPLCHRCPIRPGCAAFRRGLQERIPPSKQAPRRKRIRYLCGILEKEGSVLVARRPVSGLLPGLWEFPGGETTSFRSASSALPQLLAHRLGITAKPLKRPIRVTQTLTHRELEIQAYRCKWQGTPARPRWYTQTRWVSKKGLPAVSFTGGMAKIAKAFVGRPIS